MEYCYFKHLFSISIFFLIILTHDDFIASVTSLTICINNGNYTQRSTYSTNLNRVLSSLSTNVNDTGYYYTSFGQSPDQANAFVLCRADVSLEICKNCTRTALSEAQSTCPNRKQAVAWGEFCLVKYTNYTMYGLLETVNKYYMWNVNNATSPTQFMRDLRNLFDDLRNKASNSGDLMKVAVGDVTGPGFQSIFALVQCKPDLSPQDCTSCLINAIRDIPLHCDGKIGCRVLSESCFLRYEVDPFYNETRVRELTTVPASVPVPAPETGPNTQLMSPPTPPPPGTNGDNNSRTVIIIVVTAVAVLVILVVTGCVIFRKRRKQRPTGVHIDDNADEISTVESLQYDFGNIKTATNDFSEENKLGQGGFGAVYKGKLANGQEIAVKRLSKNSGQGDLEFKNEVLLLARLQHRNLVRLLGFSLQGDEKLLVYEFVENASLDQFIFDSAKKSLLDWDRRNKIIGGIARGILYLHEDSRLRIIHRDLKASNVLLDSEMNPKIADFGMARLFVQDDQTQGSTSRIVGTYGYMSPEYAMHGQFSVKSDVFSFGVLVLEIISGQKNNCFRDGESIQDLLSFAWRNWREGTAANIIDPILKLGSGSIREMLRCVHVGLLCVQENVADRPTMASVVLMLSSLSLTLPVPSEPAFFMPGSGYDLEMDGNARESETKNTSSSNKSIGSNLDFSKNEASITEFYPR